jgi:hypothetical protein
VSFSKLKNGIKSAVEKLPYNPGKYVSLIPNSLFFGKKFIEYKNSIEVFKNLDEKSKKEYIFERVINITQISNKNVVFPEFK